MTISEINALQEKDWLKISKPKSPAAKQHRQQIVKIENIAGVRVATVAYYDGDFHSDDDNNRCELNFNLFGDMELDNDEN